MRALVVPVLVLLVLPTLASTPLAGAALPETPALASALTVSASGDGSAFASAGAIRCERPPVTGAASSRQAAAIQCDPLELTRVVRASTLADALATRWRDAATSGGAATEDVTLTFSAADGGTLRSVTLVDALPVGYAVRAADASAREAPLTESFTLAFAHVEWAPQSRTPATDAADADQEDDEPVPDADAPEPADPTPTPGLLPFESRAADDCGLASDAPDVPDDDAPGLDVPLACRGDLPYRDDSDALALTIADAGTLTLTVTPAAGLAVRACVHVADAASASACAAGAERGERVHLDVPIASASNAGLVVTRLDGSGGYEISATHELPPAPASWQVTIPDLPPVTDGEDRAEYPHPFIVRLNGSLPVTLTNVGGLPGTPPAIRTTVQEASEGRTFVAVTSPPATTVAPGDGLTFDADVPAAPSIGLTHLVVEPVADAGPDTRTPVRFTGVWGAAPGLTAGAAWPQNAPMWVGLTIPLGFSIQEGSPVSREVEMTAVVDRAWRRTGEPVSTTTRVATVEGTPAGSRVQAQYHDLDVQLPDEPGYYLVKWRVQALDDYPHGQRDLTGQIYFRVQPVRVLGLHAENEPVYAGVEVPLFARVDTGGDRVVTSAWRTQVRAVGDPSGEPPTRVPQAWDRDSPYARGLGYGTATWSPYSPPRDRPSDVNVGVYVFHEPGEYNVTLFKALDTLTARYDLRPYRVTVLEGEAPDPQPDLDFSSVEWNTYLEIQVTNRGEAAAPESALTLKRYVNSFLGWVPIREIAVPALEPGDEFAVNVFLQSNRDDVRLRLDALEEIEESNELNNVRRVRR